MAGETEAFSDRMRHEIMLCVKANGQEVDGVFWFMLAFRTEAELVAICQDLNINVEGDRREG